MRPPKPHWLFVHFPQVKLQPLYQLLLRCDLDVPELARHLGEETLDQVQPRPVDRSEDKLEPVRHCNQVCPRLLGSMGRMVVQDDLDPNALGILGVQGLEELDELAAAVPVPDQPDHFARGKVKPGQQADRAMPDILLVPAPRGELPWHGRQVGRRWADSLDPGLLLVTDTDDSAVGGLRNGQVQLHLLMNVQHLHHLGLELGVAPLMGLQHANATTQARASGVMRVGRPVHCRSVRAALKPSWTRSAVFAW